jgi:hypothetical protein
VGSLEYAAHPVQEIPGWACCSLSPRSNWSSRIADRCQRPSCGRDRIDRQGLPPARCVDEVRYNACRRVCSGPRPAFGAEAPNSSPCSHQALRLQPSVLPLEISGYKAARKRKEFAVESHQRKGRSRQPHVITTTDETAASSTASKTGPVHGRCHAVLHAYIQFNSAAACPLELRVDRRLCSNQSAALPP